MYSNTKLKFMKWKNNGYNEITNIFEKVFLMQQKQDESNGC